MYNIHVRQLLNYKKILDGLSFCQCLNYSNIRCILNALFLQLILFVLYVNTFDHVLFVRLN